jgi:pimeloyl-ACP methyl ester carboxylesterase
MGCSSLYYYPDDYIYADPSEFAPGYTSDYVIVDGNVKLHYWFFPARGRLPGPQMEEPTSALSAPDSDRSGAESESSGNAARARVLQFHGNAQNISSHFFLGVWLIDHGFEFFTYDYRGYGKSDGSPSPEVNYQDALVIIRKNLKEVQERGIPLIILGQSMGGAIALRAIADLEEAEKDSIALVIADSTFPSFYNLVYENTSKMLFWPLDAWVAAMFDDEYSPAPFIPEQGLPLLVIHSVDDPVVPFSHGKVIYDGWGGPRWLWEIQRPGHIGWSDGGRSETDQRLLEFLDSEIL